MNLSNKVIYQIYPKSFYDSNQDGIGDLKGIIQKLDYVQQLGVDYIWLSPINQSPQRDNGYDVSDYDQIDPMFGSLDDYKQLIQEANQRSIKVMMDLVLNHTSTDHVWFKRALEGDPYYQAFYHFVDEPYPIDSIFGGSAWQFVPSIGKYYFCFFDKTQADLNWDNPNVRNELFAMVNRWIEIGVEGFRLDVIDHISKDLAHGIHVQGPYFLTYLKQLNQETFKDQFLTVGECWFASIDQMKAMCHSEGLYQAFHFEDVMITSTSQGKWYQQPFDLNKLAHVFNKWQNEYQRTPANVMNNHDLPRLVSLWLNDKEYRKKSCTLLLTVFGLLRGNWYLFQGDEIGMINASFDDLSNYRDIETLNAYKSMIETEDHETVINRLKLISRDNARVPMPWDDSLYGGFSTTKPWIDVLPSYQTINVKKDRNSVFSIYKYVQSLIKYRKQHVDWLDQSIEFQVLNDVLFLKRKELVVVANFSNHVQKILQTGVVAFSNDTVVTNELQPYQVIVYEQ